MNQATEEATIITTRDFHHLGYKIGFKGRIAGRAVTDNGDIPALAKRDYIEGWLCADRIYNKIADKEQKYALLQK